MSSWPNDIYEMHKKYGTHEWIEKKVGEYDIETLKKFLQFRIDFLDEELNETKLAIENNDAEEIVDGLIDLCVVAIGTLDAFGIDAQKAWNEVHNANMNKEKGIKPSRPNPLGMPDLIKKEDWVAPSHKDNLGHFIKITSLQEE